jgi:hypothetical protein
MGVRRRNADSLCKRKFVSDEMTSAAPSQPRALRARGRRLALEPSSGELAAGREIYDALAMDLEKLGFDVTIVEKPYELFDLAQPVDLTVRLAYEAESYVVERLTGPLLVRVGYRLRHRSRRRQATILSVDGAVLRKLTLSEPASGADARRVAA